MRWVEVHGGRLRDRRRERARERGRSRSARSHQQVHLLERRARRELDRRRLAAELVLSLDLVRCRSSGDRPGRKSRSSSVATAERTVSGHGPDGFKMH